MLCIYMYHSDSIISATFTYKLQYYNTDKEKEPCAMATGSYALVQHFYFVLVRRCTG